MNETGALTAYLGERYVPVETPNEDVGAAVRRIRAVAEQMGREGIQIRHLCSTLVQADETCLSLFEALEPEAVGEAGRRAGFPQERISEALRVAPTRMGPTPRASRGVRMRPQGEVTGG
jgi:alkanesulfonate monooxygenase SsuD/methylene tetrahydromethanopterin reductase-like flavin-dependent oxidoreductase (luciferase family)